MTPQEQEDAKVRNDMQRLAKHLDQQLPYGWGFVFLAFPFGQGGRLNYVANADRPDVVRVMYEFIERSKEKFGEHLAEEGAVAEDEALGRYRQRIAELEGLITELCDALEEVEGAAWQQRFGKLIQHARKATIIK